MARKKTGPRPEPPRLTVLADAGLGPFAAVTTAGPPSMPAPVEADAGAAAEWTRMVGLMTDNGTLSPADSGVLMDYCLDYSLIARCEAKLRREGLTVKNPDSGAIKAHPLLAVVGAAKVRLLRSAGLLGATPVDRGRAKQVEGAKSKGGKLAKYL